MKTVPNTRQRTGTGEIVPRRYELEIAQRTFFAVLFELVPEAMEPFNEIVRLLSSDIGTKWGRATSLLANWQETYRLTGLWGTWAFLSLARIENPSADLQPASVYEGRVRSRGNDGGNGLAVGSPLTSRYVTRSGMIRDSDSYAVLLTHLLYSDDDYDEWPGDADIGEFDPRAETVDQAVKRILPAVERRLRYGLQTIKEQDASGDTVPARALPARRHFEWAVRYQVRGETIAQIAESDEVERRTVSRNIRDVAQLIGLTLRPPDTGDPITGGRPKKPKTRTLVYRKQQT